MEAQLIKKKKETQEYTSGCYAEAKKMLEEVQLADHEMDMMEKEAAEVLKVISFCDYLFNNILNLKCQEFFKLRRMSLLCCCIDKPVSLFPTVE